MWLLPLIISQSYCPAQGFWMSHVNPNDDYYHEFVSVDGIL